MYAPGNPLADINLRETKQIFNANYFFNMQIAILLALYWPPAQEAVSFLLLSTQYDQDSAGQQKLYFVSFLWYTALRDSTEVISYLRIEWFQDYL